MEKISAHANRRQFMQAMGLGAAAMTLSPLSSGRAGAGSKRPNVLFIPVDDLRPQLGCFGNKQMISPNIDHLAKNGMVFERAYCQQPICMATRASLMSGYRPDYANIYNCEALQTLAPDALTLNKHFENNGYEIWATGKIYHHGIDHRTQFGKRWIEPKGDWEGRGYLSEEAKQAVKEYQEYWQQNNDGESGGRGPAFESPDVPDDAYADGAQTTLAIKQLQNFAKGGKPFFMAVGYHKPHLPFNAPRKYWDMYPPDKINLADNPFLPKNATEYTAYNWNELRNYIGMPQGESLMPDDLARKLVHGYYACVSYTDAQIGRLLNELERLGLRDNTVVVLWGDHGWKLGEHGMWCKHTPFELDCHVPLIISAPGMKHRGEPTRAFAEFIDIYPTLCELCGLELPDHLEGDSLVPVMQKPTREWKKATFTQWPRNNRQNPDKVLTGYTVKTDRYRYVEWTKNKSGQVMARELYDHHVDPNENVNIAGMAEHQPVVEQLAKLLQGGKGWKSIRPRR